MKKKELTPQEESDANFVELINTLIEVEKSIAKLTPEERESNKVKMGDIWY